MKVIRKSDNLRGCQEGHLRAERDFLVASENSQWYDLPPCVPYRSRRKVTPSCRIISLFASFQDEANLYLVMEYMPGGDFLGLLIRQNILSEDAARFYIAEMILAVEETHRMKCIHRDIKPDNFLISSSGHLKISDFGLAFDGHWSHDSSYYNCHRYSILAKLGINIKGDDQDKKEAHSVQAQLKWVQGFQSVRDKHEKKISHRQEKLLPWRNRCGMRTCAHSVVGTSQYMAPEVVQGQRYDGRCD
jgi:protein-serine/threonine kinase